MQKPNQQKVKVPVCRCSQSGKLHYHHNGHIHELIDYPEEFIVDGFIEVYLEVPNREE